VFSSDGNHLACRGRGWSKVWQRRRPEQWWGIAWLWEFWLTVAFGGFLVWNIVRDRRYFRRLREANGDGLASQRERTPGAG
jgi:hypothetical protein